MRFFHLSDLHIGKQLHHYNLKEDQEHILREIVQYARELTPDAIIIAGDIYDKSVPSAEAVEIFDDFLTELAQIEVPVSDGALGNVVSGAEENVVSGTPENAMSGVAEKTRRHILILFIAGNHDNAQRLDYAKAILRHQHIYIAGKAPETADEHIRRVTFYDAYGEVDVWMLPFLKPGYVRGVFAQNPPKKQAQPEGSRALSENGQAQPEGSRALSENGQAQPEGSRAFPESYQEAVERLLEREQIDWSRRNILVSHQFYAGADGEMLTCDSENVQVGGIDRIDGSVVKRFDYVALGHLHGAQCAGYEHVRYCGTLLKYSVSESEQEKTLHVINVKAKGEPVEVTKYPLHPLRDVRRVRGSLEEILEHVGAGNEEKPAVSVSDLCGDYVSITLTDEVEPYKPKEQLERKFSHILEIRLDNTRTRQKLSSFVEETQAQDPLTLFGEFYREVQGRALSEEETKILQNIFEEM